MTELNRREQKLLNAALLVTGVLLFAYTAVRACLLSITWDEAYTYIEFVRNRKILLHAYDTMSANNHLLNTTLMIFFTKIFGLSEFALRLHVLIAHLLFLFFSARLLKNLGNKWLIISAFIIVNANPYLLDFFSIARGYGLSIGLMMASLYYFYLLHTAEKKNTNAILSIVFACLAVFANFVLLNYCVVLFGLIVLLYAYNAAKSSESSEQKYSAVLKGLSIPTLLIALLLYIVVPIALKLKGSGALFFGGNSGFWSDTISTVTHRVFYDVAGNRWLERLAKGFVFLILIAASCFVTIRFSKKQVSGRQLFLTSLLLLIGLCCLSTLVQHRFIGTLYLMDRTALFLVVLFNLAFVFFLSELAAVKRFIMVVAPLTATVVVFHFCLAFNLTYVLEWNLDASTKEMLADLQKIKTVPPGKETVSIGIPLIFDPAINFYREKNSLSWLNTVVSTQTHNMRNDYFFLSQEDLATFNRDSITIIKTYPITQNVLAKPRYAPKQIIPVFTKELTFEKERQQQFIVDPKTIYGPGFSCKVNDSVMPDNNAVISVSATLKAPNTGKDNLVLVISFQDKNGKLYYWEKAYVKDFIKNKNDWFRAIFTCVVPQKTQAGDEIKAYIWNPEKQMLYIKKMELEWLAYKY